jgi:hypothetical protein
MDFKRVKSFIEIIYQIMQILWLTFWSLIAFVITLAWIIPMNIIKNICPDAFDILTISHKNK